MAERTGVESICRRCALGNTQLTLRAALLSFGALLHKVDGCFSRVRLKVPALNSRSFPGIGGENTNLIIYGIHDRGPLEGRNLPFRNPAGGKQWCRGTLSTYAERSKPKRKA